MTNNEFVTNKIESKVKRNSSIDIIKIFLIVLVVIAHSGLPYFIGPGGYWYFKSTSYNSNLFTLFFILLTRLF